ncbi:MAG: DNA polymerase III subunit gamma/tau, partial [Bacteroidales bacterium]|nr:DNA polymerase III subunit gamma/tau [Bacteroidales bacterium]
EILLKGFDAQHFMAGLNSHMRDLLMCRDASTANLLEVGQSTKEKYQQQAANCSVDFLYEALKIINDSEQQYRAAKNKRLHIEFALIRLARIVTEKKN